jgi:hypothetical protein
MIKTCEICNNEFWAKRSDAKTCSTKCRVKKSRKGVSDPQISVTFSQTTKNAITTNRISNHSNAPKVPKNVTLSNAKMRQKIVERIKELHGDATKKYDYPKNEHRISQRKWWMKEARRFVKEIDLDNLASLLDYRTAKAHRWLVKGICDVRFRFPKEIDYGKTQTEVEI